MTTLEVPKNPEVKPFIKPEQNIETVKKPAVTLRNLKQQREVILREVVIR